MGLLVGGVFKYLMVIIIIIPGIALVAIMKSNPLSDPDQAYTTMVNILLPAGVRGIILCGLFASLMSTVDSIYNSVSTLWSIDIYKRHIRPDATSEEVVRMGKKAIIATFFAGALFAFIQIYVKYRNPEFALTHWFNEMSYYVKNGFVVLIMAAVFLIRPARRLVLFSLLASIIMYLAAKMIFPEVNYLVRSGWVVCISFIVVAAPTMFMNGWRIPAKDIFTRPSRSVAWFGAALLASLLFCHVVFH